LIWIVGIARLGILDMQGAFHAPIYGAWNAPYTCRHSRAGGDPEYLENALYELSFVQSHYA